MFKAQVRVGFRSGVADPEGENTKKALTLLGFDGIDTVRSGRVFDIQIQAEDADEARERAEAMCTRLLANPVVHDYTIEVEPVA